MILKGLFLVLRKDLSRVNPCIAISVYQTLLKLDFLLFYLSWIYCWN